MPLGLPDQYDVASVRGLYTGLSDGWTYLNAHAAPQIAERVAAGVARSFRTSAAVAAQEEMVGAHSAQRTPGQLEGAATYEEARRAVADLVGSRAECVVLGPSLPVLYQSLSRALRPLIRRNSSVVLSKLDPPALYSAFTEVDATVRWAQPDLGTGELPAFQFAELVDGSTRLVVFSAAHELLGTVAPTAEILGHVHERSRAWALVDVTALAPYRPLDFDDFGADILGVDLGLLGGPQLAALVFRDTAMFRRLDALSPDKAGDTAAKLETPVSPGLAGGVGPLVDHLAVLAGGERGSRRVRLARSLERLNDYMDDLRADLYTLLGTLPAVHILGVTGEAAAGASEDRLPRLTFAVRGVPAEVVHRRLFDNGLVTTVAPRSPLLSEMGVEEIGGAVTVALGPFNTRHDIEHLTRVVASLA
ncbi:aminotransferase class V-fold PLP-dependent enzyme [Corynebacterium sp.]|uniref:aminotransferase class V-fold PLP-dependent enzyme n=1 Tax=Corynebacterium sp. TaxID=1720 RepID=UPI0026DCB253|nr:aminotransferase class V-fold PLP-dependent enzyme [Corynebacterium sp.]MDO5032565.1 aminotransferase class V-fold PLP-dependent enzyme [Corynebacterium sp.]